VTGPQFSLRLEVIKKIFYDTEPELMVLLKTSVVVGGSFVDCLGVSIRACFNPASVFDLCFCSNAAGSGQCIDSSFASI